MRKPVLGLIFAGFVGSASAGELDRADARYYDSNDYSAKVYYRLDFGGATAHAQTLGLRFDNQLAESRGAPAVFQTSFDSSGVASVKLHGVDLRGQALAAGAAASGGFFESLTVAQWVGIGFTALVFGTVVSEASKSNETAVPGSGGA